MPGVEWILPQMNSLSAWFARGNIVNDDVVTTS